MDSRDFLYVIESGYFQLNTLYQNIQGDEDEKTASTYFFDFYFSNTVN
jgi:hypothetical protein